jgi:hypothetical protein
LICICGWNIVAGTTSYEIENYNSLPHKFLLFENLCSFKGQIVTGQTHTQNPPRPPPNSGAFILSLFLEESSIELFRAIPQLLLG